MTEGKKQKKGVQLTHSETKERNLLLKKLEKNGDFDRCVMVQYSSRRCFSCRV